MLFECQYSFFPPLPLKNVNDIWNHPILMRNERITTFLSELFSLIFYLKAKKKLWPEHTTLARKRQVCRAVPSRCKTPWPEHTLCPWVPWWRPRCCIEWPATACTPSWPSAGQKWSGRFSGCWFNAVPWVQVCILCTRICEKVPNLERNISIKDICHKMFHKNINKKSAQYQNIG